MLASGKASDGRDVYIEENTVSVTQRVVVSCSVLTASFGN